MPPGRGPKQREFWAFIVSQLKKPEWDLGLSAPAMSLSVTWLGHRSPCPLLCPCHAELSPEPAVQLYLHGVCSWARAGQDCPYWLQCWVPAKAEQERWVVKNSEGASESQNADTAPGCWWITSSLMWATGSLPEPLGTEDTKWRLCKSKEIFLVWRFSTSRT